MMKTFQTYTKSGIISPEDLNDLLSEKNSSHQNKIKLIDATYVLPGASINPKEEFQNKRIGNAVFFDIDHIAQKDTELPHMLPDAKTFAAEVSNLGISNDDLIVVYGQTGMIMGPARVWWTFKGFGHENIVVLDGGLPTWEKAGLETNSTPSHSLKKGQYVAPPFNKTMCVDLSQMRTISENAAHPILDARPLERFNGTVPEPRPGLRTGHIPASKCIPCTELVVPQTGRLKSKHDLQKILKRELPSSANAQTRIIATCGSGITACAIALALHNIGYKNVSVYDGSWSEWGHTDTNTKISSTA